MSLTLRYPRMLALIALLVIAILAIAVVALHGAYPIGHTLASLPQIIIHDH